MKIKNYGCMLVLCGVFQVSCGQSTQQNKNTMSYELSKSDAEWKAQLSDEQYYILREKGTERAFSGNYWNHRETGVYYCAACELPLFDSKTKFKSGTGWPSFYEPFDERAVHIEMDYSYGMRREEVLCKRCGGHLGHLFNDGPKPTGLRYCINSASLHFQKKASKEQEVKGSD